MWKFLVHILLKPGVGLVAKSSLTFATPWTVACQAPLSMGFSRQKYWSGLPFPSPADLPDPGTELQVSCIAGRFFTTSATRELNYTSIKIEDPWADLTDWGIQLRETWWVLFIAICRSLSELMKSPQIPLKVRMSLSVATHVLKTKVGKEARVLAATMSTLI